MKPGLILSTRTITYAALMAALTALGGWCTINVPFSPVPYTLQTFFVLFSGFMLGPWGGAMSQFIYILMGCIGIPVFSGFSAGPGALIGPTGGFLVGFIPSSMLCGFYIKRRPGATFPEILLISCAASLVLYGTGVFWLSCFFSTNLQKALLVAVAPFLPGDAVKMVLCSLMVIRMRTQLGKPLPLE
jgi:biotin transport system substrate-specific component